MNQTTNEIPDNMKMVCIHVFKNHAQPEYLEEDDSYVCTPCRDRFADEGFESISPLLSFVCVDCLIENGIAIR